MPFLGPGKAIRWSRLIGPAVILLAAVVAISPQLIRGNSCGHDFDFHLLSWLDVQNSWRSGLFYPHWAPSANFGAGEPRFVFYPPLTWMLGAALGLALPWQWVPIALTFLLLAGTGLATRALARQALTDGAATLAGCAALFSGYALFTAYERSAFGELSGGLWIPLVLLLILRDRNSSAPTLRTPLWKRALDGSALPLALVMAGVWLSNVPLGVMASYLLAAVAVVAALLKKSWAPVLRATMGAVLGIGLAALYLVPAIVEQRWVDIRQAIDDPGLLIENSWLFARHANPMLELHDVELHRVSMIASGMIAVALIGLLVSWMRGSLPGGHRWWVPLALIPIAILFLQFPISLPVWNLLPKLRFLQFPWRWLVVLEAPMAIFFASAVWCAGRWRRVAVATLCAVFFLTATVAAGRLFFQVCDDEDAVQGTLDVYRSGAGFLGTDEYEPPGADDTMVPSGLPDSCLVKDPATVLGKGPEGGVPVWTADQGTCEAVFPKAPESWRVRPENLHIRALIAHPGTLILRLRSYPAWRVRVNGQPITALPQREDGLLAVPVPQGPVDLTVDWTTTRDVIAGRWLSGLAALLLTAVWFWERKLARSRLS
ncbi:MAG: 6-pyruvoyl-tetrahydropterin synthase-related protein [Terracidiphilus sp.]|nr:6-pyruvoyl-tetrahydropterin synthase-related protein [Terracidiphilus sp.]